MNAVHQDTYHETPIVEYLAIRYEYANECASLWNSCKQMELNLKWFATSAEVLIEKLNLSAIIQFELFWKDAVLEESCSKRDLFEKYQNVDQAMLRTQAVFTITMASKIHSDNNMLVTRRTFASITIEQLVHNNDEKMFCLKKNAKYKWKIVSMFALPQSKLNR